MQLVTPPPTPPPPKKKNIISFQFLLGIKVIPREIEDYFFIYFLLEEGGGKDKLHYGLCENGALEYKHIDDGKDISDTLACGSCATFLF